MKFKTIHKSSTPEMVIREILNGIKSENIKPGDKLPTEREMGKMFGVGRSSVREAMMALSLVGYLEITQGKGTFLRKDMPDIHISRSRLKEINSAVNIIDIIEVREILEFNSVSMAAKKIDKTRINQLRQKVIAMEESKTDIKKFYEADFNFHMEIARFSENSMMYDLLKVVIEKSHQQYLKFIPDPLYDLDMAIETANELIVAMDNGNGMADPAECMRRHLGTVREGLKMIIPVKKK
jgi:GntR family transcriptional regulator, transcriptional repressor for pyruvate dehydrogenase complex